MLARFALVVCCPSAPPELTTTLGCKNSGTGMLGIHDATRVLEVIGLLYSSHRSPGYWYSTLCQLKFSCSKQQYLAPAQAHASLIQVIPSR